jgi:hypothetical protein
MPEHPHTGRCILVAAMALFGTALFAAAAAQAVPKDSLAKDTGSKDASPAISLDQLGGTWKNAKSGVNVRIEQGAVGWEVWFSTSGEARITLPEKNRPAIKIDGRNFTCSYSVTLPSAQTMKWDLTQGQPEAECLTGMFTRLEPAPTEVKRAAPAPVAKPAVKAGQPLEANKPPQTETSSEPAPTRQSPAARPIMAPTRTLSRSPALWAARRMATAFRHWRWRHAAAYRRLPARFAIRNRRWRLAGAPWPYAAAGGYRPYRYFHYQYRWYVVLVPRCGCR